MFDEIGEIFYTLVVGYIGALEICYIAKHIYHLTHQCIFQESEESRLKALEDIQEHLKRAVEEKKQEKQVDGIKNETVRDGLLNEERENSQLKELENIKEQLKRSIEENQEKHIEDSLLNKDIHKENQDEQQLKRNKREIDSTLLPLNNKTKNNENLENNERITIGEEKDVKKEKIIQINENESLKSNLDMFQEAETKNQNEINETLQQENFVVDAVAKNNETSSSTLLKEYNMQKNEHRTEGRFNITDLSETELHMSNTTNENKTNEDELIRSDVNNVITKESSADSKLDDINEININESSGFATEIVDENKNNVNENISLSESSKNIQSTEVQSSTLGSFSNDSLFEISKEKEIYNNDFLSNESNIGSQNLSTEIVLHNELDQDEIEFETQNDMEIQLEYIDSESSADDEGNSISSVIEKKITEEENHDAKYKLILTKEEKEKVINFKAEDMNFKDISQILKNSDIIDDEIVEAPLEEEFSNEDMVSESQMQQLENREGFSNVYDEDASIEMDVGSGNRLRRSPRIVEMDHYEERWKNEDYEHQKQNQHDVNEEFIAAEKGIDYQSLKSEDTDSNITSALLKEEQNLGAENLVSESHKPSKAERAGLFLNISGNVTRKDQNLTPTIELFDESGIKSSSVISEPSTPFTTSSSILEGLSDFYDFNASINPSRSPSVSRSTSVQPLSPAPDNKPSSSGAVPKTPDSLSPNVIPKNIENLSDFYDFNVKLNQTVYPKKSSFADGNNSKNFILKELNNEVCSNFVCIKETSPSFSYSFKELKMLSEMSISPSSLQSQEPIPNKNSSTEISKPDSNFMRSQYVGASTDYSYDFEDLREQARNFIRSRSPSLSFGDDIMAISMEDYRKELQDNILKELQEKSVNYDYLEIDKKYSERERRESDSALLKKTEIVFQIQDEPDFIESQNKYNVFVEDIEIEPEEYHHFRRFSMQQEHQIEQYPEDDFIYLDKETMDVMSSECIEKFQDNIIDIEQLSLYSEETTEIILKTIKENVALDAKTRGDTDVMDEKDISDTLKYDNLDQVDLEYVPKKEYNWRKNFKLEDDCEKEESMQNINDHITEVLDLKPNVNDLVEHLKKDINGLSNENGNIVNEDITDLKGIKNVEEEIFDIIKTNDVQNLKCDEDRKEKFSSNGSNSEEEQLHAKQLDATQYLNNKEDEKVDAQNNEVEHKEQDLDEETFDIVNAKEVEDIQIDVENHVHNGHRNFINDGGYGSNEKLSGCEQIKYESSLNGREGNLSREMSNESENDEDYELEEDNFDLVNTDEIEDCDTEDKIYLKDSLQENNHVSEEKQIVTTDKSEIANVETKDDSNIEDNYLEAALDADDGIDEVIYDYNDRGDECYDQSECGENNNYDMDTYEESRDNETENNLQLYNNIAERVGRSINNDDIAANNSSSELSAKTENINISKSSENTKTTSSSKLILHDNLLFESQSKSDNGSLDKQFDKMYDDFIQNRRESHIEKDYNGIVEKMNKNYNDDTMCIRTDEIIEQIYFKDLSPSRYERLGSEDSLSSSYSSLSQGSLSTRSKYKGISHARQIKSDRLRLRYGIAPAIGAFANFENTDDTPISYLPRKEYNWRKNFKLDDLDLNTEKCKNTENNFQTSDNNVEMNGNEKQDLEKVKSEGYLNEQNVEGYLNKKIDTMYDEVLKNRRKSRIDKEFEEIAEEIEIQTEELIELDSVPTEKILKDVLVINDEIHKDDKNSQESENDVKKSKSKKKSRKNSDIVFSSENAKILGKSKDENVKYTENSVSNHTNETAESLSYQKDEKNESIMITEKFKKKTRKNSTISIISENSELKSFSIETTENIENTEKPKKKKSSRKSSLISIDAEESNENEVKLNKKSKKSKKRQSIDESETAQIVDFVDNSNYSTTSEVYDVTESFTTPQKIGTPPNTPNESITDDAEKFSNPSISNSSLSLVSSQAKLDRIGENDILDLIRDSSILGSSF